MMFHILFPLEHSVRESEIMSTVGGLKKEDIKRVPTDLVNVTI